jgi:regulator of protease activity HflC (stomatin/prohibitin superfamily)
MADITRRFFLRHLRSSGTSYVRHTRRGTVAHQGVGQSFWYRPLDAVLSEVPVDDRELPMLFHARTRDYQDVAVQGTVTFRLAAPDVAASRLDFSLDPVTGRWRSTPLDQVAGLLVETAQQHAAQLVARQTLAETIAAGVGAVRQVVGQGLAADARLAEVGVTVVAVRVMGIRPEPDVEKALQTPAREAMQQDADRATYERRALAVERESAIGRNELESRIVLARQEEQLVAQRGANNRREAEESASAAKVRVEADASQVREMARAEAEAAEGMGQARAHAEAARLEAYRDLPQATLLGLALQELAANLPQVQSLVLTPDLLAPVLARLGAADAPQES